MKTITPEAAAAAGAAENCTGAGCPVGGAANANPQEPAAVAPAAQAKVPTGKVPAGKAPPVPAAAKEMTETESLVFIAGAIEKMQKNQKLRNNVLTIKNAKGALRKVILTVAIKAVRYEGAVIVK